MPDDELGGGVDSFSDDTEEDRGTFVANVPRDPRPPEDTLASWDRGSQIPRRTSGYSWDNYRKHPPLPCSNPRFQASYRGYYKCPGCGENTRLVGYRTGRELGYEMSDTITEGISQAWSIFVDLLFCLGRVIRWAWCRLVLKRSVTEETDEETGPMRIDPRAVYAVAMLAKIAAAQRRGEAGQARGSDQELNRGEAPELAVTPANYSPERTVSHGN